MISPIVLCLCIPHFGKIWICSPKSLFQLLLIPNLQSWGDEKSLTLIIWHLVILFWPFVKTFSSTASNENIAKGTTDPRVEVSLPKFEHKSRPNFIFRISTKHQLQLQPNISISTKSSIKLQNLDQISTKIQFHNLYKTSAEKNCPNSSFKSCLNFKILTKPCAQNISKSLTFFTKPQLRNLQQIAANKILISNSCNINKFWVGIFKRQGYINHVY